MKSPRMGKLASRTTNPSTSDLRLTGKYLIVAAGVLFKAGMIPWTMSWWPFSNITREKSESLSELWLESGVVGLAMPHIFICGMKGGLGLGLEGVKGGGVVGVGVFAIFLGSQC